MPRKKLGEPQSLDEQLMELPANVRPTAAAARNASIRVREHREAMLAESKKVKAHVRTLRYRHELSIYRIARFLELSESRVRTILDLKKGESR